MLSTLLSSRPALPPSFNFSQQLSKEDYCILGVVNTSSCYKHFNILKAHFSYVTPIHVVARGPSLQQVHPICAPQMREGKYGRGLLCAQPSGDMHHSHAQPLSSCTSQLPLQSDWPRGWEMQAARGEWLPHLTVKSQRSG